MPRIQEHKQAYEVTKKWKNNCLLDNKGLIWKNEAIWTDENLYRFQKAFIDRPDESGKSFDEKLKNQLAGEDEGVYKYAIELLFIYYIVPTRTRYETKVNKLEMVAEWKNISIDRDLPIFEVLKEGIAGTGASFNTRMYFEICMIHMFAQNVKGLPIEERKRILNDHVELKALNESTRKEVGTRVQMQHMLQYLLLPDYFERIANWGHKEQIVKTYSHLLEDSSSEDIDEQIRIIKAKLRDEYPNEDIDFYNTPFIEQQWRLGKKMQNYFWISANPSIFTVEEILTGNKIEYPLFNDLGNKRKHVDLFKNAKAGDLVVLYEPGTSRKILGKGKIEQGIHKNEQNEDVISFSLTDKLDPISWDDITKDPVLQQSIVVRQENRGSIFTLTKEEYETIMNWQHESLQVREVGDHVEDHLVPIPSVSFDIEPDNIELVFEDEDILIDQIMTAIQSGKHIILTGPPGTGKSKLAKIICDMYDVEPMMVTAASNWSTYETIGGYRPDQEGHLYFDDGIFLQCVKDKQTYEPINNWLIIDEINRADIDKAFGSLFSVLTGDDVTLPFQSKSGQSIRMKPQGNSSTVKPDDFTYIIPNDWRIIGTMNTIDKASLYEMSYAFMRRFAFIPVGIPKNITQSLVKQYLDMWGMSSYPHVEGLTTIWKIINDYRKIGPAIVEDIAQYSVVNDDFASAIMLYVLPQFEGLPTNKIKEFSRRLVEETDIIPDRSMLDDFIEDFFHLGDF